MNGLVLLSLSFMFSVGVHFSPAASLTPGLLQGQECESLWWHYGWMESSRVITSERNNIHSAFKIETPHIFSINRTCLKLFITRRSYYKATFFVGVFHQSESSPELIIPLAQYNYLVRPKPMTPHIPQTREQALTLDQLCLCSAAVLIPKSIKTMECTSCLTHK